MAEGSVAPSAEVRRARFRVIGLFGGFKVSQAIYCAVALRVPDALQSGPLSAQEIAAACGCDVSRLERLLAALCAVALVTKSGAQYAATTLSACLCRDTPGSLAPMILFQGRELYRAYSQLLTTLKSGVPGWKAEFGCDLWEYLEEHPETAAFFDGAMADGPENDLDAIATAGDGPLHVVDVGGGNGWLMRRVLQRQHTWTGTVFDRPDVVERARTDPGLQSLATRCRFVGGDFFREVPAGADLYLMRHVLHDWDDEDCIRILSSCHRAMSATAKLLVMEAPMGDSEVTKGLTEWSNLSMMLIGGAERPIARYQELLSASGFVAPTAKEVGPSLFVIEAGRGR